MALEFAGAAVALRDEDIAAAAAQLGIEAAVVRAVDEVESRGRGFLPDKRPTILFERHVFSRRTGHRYDIGHPDISNPVAGGYGAAGAHQYDRLAEAIRLYRKAALQSASWGRYQVMGFNAEICGWPDVEAFVADMMKGEALHLQAFIGYCRANDLVRFLATHDWRSFTRGYNGPGNVDDYSQKLAAAYRRHATIMPPLENAGPSPIDDIRSAQRKLMAAGLLKKRSGAPATEEDIDGDPGEMTRAAATAWRAAHRA